MIKTNDIDLAAFLMTEKFKIANVELSGNERWPVVFALASEDEKAEKQIRKTFDDKSATVNVRDFIERMATVRNIALSIRRNGDMNNGRNGHKRS